jgi:hypothetical protein
LRGRMPIHKRSKPDFTTPNGNRAAIIRAQQACRDGTPGVAGFMQPRHFGLAGLTAAADDRIATRPVRTDAMAPPERKPERA